MQKTIVIIGTVDTKGEQLRFLRKCIASRGHRAIIMDVSSGGKPGFEADIAPREIAGLMGKDIDQLIAVGDRFTNGEVMTAGARQKLLDLLAANQLDGAVALGGSTIALLAARAMQALPFGIPKVLVVPAAMPVYLHQWFDASDILVMQIIMEMAGMNDLLTHSIAQAAGLISGMVEESKPYTSLQLPPNSVAITEVGFCPKCPVQVEKLLEAEGFNVFTFHAQGVSERAMDRLVGEGFLDGVVDIVPTGIIEEMFGGNRAGGMERMDAFATREIPLVVSFSVVNLTGCGPTRKNREKYASRVQVPIDALRSMTRYDDDELKEAAPVYARKLNAAKGPVTIVLPLRGWSALDREGSLLYNPEQDRVFVDALKKDLDPRIPIVEVDANLEDMEFSRALVGAFKEICGKPRIESSGGAQWLSQ